MTDNALIDLLAEQVLYWRVAPDRFLKRNRSWLPKWRFNPIQRLEDAFLLLDHSQPTRYVISQTGGKLQVEVERDGKIGRATADSKPRAITLALARSLDVEV